MHRRYLHLAFARSGAQPISYMPALRTGSSEAMLDLQLINMFQYPTAVPRPLYVKPCVAPHCGWRQRSGKLGCWGAA